MRKKFYRSSDGVTDGPFTLIQIRKLLKYSNDKYLFAKQGSDEWFSQSVIVDQIQSERSRQLWIILCTAVLIFLSLAVSALFFLSSSNRTLKNSLTKLESSESAERSALVKQLERETAKVLGVGREFDILKAENVNLSKEISEVRSDLNKSQDDLNELAIEAGKAREAAIFSSQIASRFIFTLGKQANKPRSIIINSNVNDGQLSFDPSWISGVLSPVFKNNGLRVITQSSAGEAWLVSVRIQQIEISGGINSAYSVNVGLFAPGQTGYSRKAVMVKELFTIGHAGTSSDYLTSTRKFLENSAAVINGAIEATSEDAVDYETLGELFERLEQAGINLGSGYQRPDQARNRASGSGFLIDGSKLVITNYHVVENGSKIRVAIDSTEQEAAATIAFSDPLRDLALLLLAEPINQGHGAFSPCFTPVSDLKLGTRVFGFGFPLSSILGPDIKYSEGVISGEPVEGIFQISAPVQPGNSGGAIFTDDNRICGLVVATLNPLHVLDSADALPQNVNYAISSDVIQDFLQRAGIPLEFADEPEKDFDRNKARSLSVRVIVE